MKSERAPLPPHPPTAPIGSQRLHVLHPQNCFLEFQSRPGSFSYIQLASIAQPRLGVLGQETCARIPLFLLSIATETLIGQTDEE